MTTERTAKEDKRWPPILDTTCGGRQMWFDKHNPLCLYLDNREIEEIRLCDNRRFEVKPDMIADFTNLPFPDGTFHLVVFDPPHLVRVSDTAYMKIKYERLPRDWESVIRAGFNECMRVLVEHGTLIFKWSEIQIPTNRIIEAIGERPLFGHISGKKSKTQWMTFIKLSGETTRDGAIERKAERK